MEDFIQHMYKNVQGIFGLCIIIAVGIEWVILMITKSIDSHKEGFVNIVSYLLQSLPYIFLGKILILGTMLWVHQHRIFNLGYAWYIWILAYVAYDFMFYLMHYIGHQVRFFWCIHGVHHTAEEMKLTVAVRGSFLIFIHMPHTVLWLPFLGFDPFMILIVEAVAHAYGLYEHINERFVGRQKWLGFLFITPSLHRVHHAKNHKYLDRNYGETFSIWDRVFGTLQHELEDEPPKYGIMGDHINSESIWQIQWIFWKELWQDIRSAPKWIDKVKYLIMPPGWNHRDGGKKASEYRAEAWTQNNNLVKTPDA